MRARSRSTAWTRPGLNAAERRAAGRAAAADTPPTCSTSRPWTRSARPRTAARRRRAILDRSSPGIPGDQHPRDLSEGQRLALVAGARAGGPAAGRAARRADPRASTTPAKRGLADDPARAGRRGPMRCWSPPTTWSSPRWSPTRWWCWPRGRSSPPGRYAAWSPSRRRSPRRSPRCSGRRGCGSTRSTAGAGGGVVTGLDQHRAVPALAPRRRGPRRRVGRRADDAGLAAAAPGAAGTSGSTRRSCSWPCCRW